MRRISLGLATGVVTGTALRSENAESASTLTESRAVEKTAAEEEEEKEVYPSQKLEIDDEPSAELAGERA